MQKYRDKLVSQIKNAAISLETNADNLVDQMDLHTGSVIITIEIDENMIPVIKMEQSHIAYLPEKYVMFNREEKP